MSQIRYGTLLSYGGLGINILIGLLYTPWMIHSIGRENFGLYTLAISIISLFVFDFGLSSAVSRFLSKYLAEGNQQKANNCLGLVARLYLVLDVVLLLIFVGVYFFIPDIYAKLTVEEIEKFKIIYVIASIFSVLSFPFIPCNGILISNEKFIQLKLCDLAHKLIIVAAMSVCLLLGYGLYALVAVNALAGISTILLKLWCIKKYTRTRPNFNYKSTQERREVFLFFWLDIFGGGKPKDDFQYCSYHIGYDVRLFLYRNFGSGHNCGRICLYICKCIEWDVPSSRFDYTCQ